MEQRGPGSAAFPMAAVRVMHLTHHLLPPVTPREEMKYHSQYEFALEFRGSSSSLHRILHVWHPTEGELVFLILVSGGC